ncbi:MAG: response regulator transcription factor [Anaerolineales bacterium]|nr:response regulator transcription factor [Anaerolineales bacterium]
MVNVNETGDPHLVVILLVALPGTRRDALVALLRALPEVRVGGVTDESEELFALTEICHPDAILTDANIWVNQRHLADDIKQRTPDVRYLAIVDGPAQRDVCLQAGAHLALLRSGLNEQALRAVLELNNNNTASP